MITQQTEVVDGVRYYKYEDVLPNGIVFLVDTNFYKLSSGRPKPILRVKASRTPLSRPILRQLTLPEWAFKLGANSPQGTDPHEAIKVIKWPQYLSMACARGYTYSVWYYYFQLGQVQGTASLAEVEALSKLYRKAEDAALSSLNSAQYLPDYVKPDTTPSIAVRALCSA
jgi:hypothetical protein